PLPPIATRGRGTQQEVAGLPSSPQLQRKLPNSYQDSVPTHGTVCHDCRLGCVQREVSTKISWQRKLGLGYRLGFHSFSGLYNSWGDRKSTRLNSSHGSISYAVFCLQ